MSGQPQRVAVVDVGSNTIKVLVAGRSAGGQLEPLFAQTSEVRISQGIGQSARPSLRADSIAAGAEAIAHLLDAARSHAPEHIEIVATSAVRDAANGTAFVEAVQQRTGHRPRILSGLEEAGAIAAGALADPQLPNPEEFVLLDLGGGSLERIHCRAGHAIHAESLPLGAVRLHEQCCPDPHAPLSETTLAALDTAIERVLASSDFRYTSPDIPLIGTGGAFTITRQIAALGAGRRRLEEASPYISRADLRALYERVAPMSFEERCTIPGLPPGRADILPTALHIVLKVVSELRTPGFYHSLYNLRYGRAAHLLGLIPTSQ